MTRAILLSLLALTGCGTVARIPINIACTLPPSPLCSVERRDRLWVCADLGRCAVKDYPRTR